MDNFEELDYLQVPKDTTILKNLSTMGNRLKELQLKMLQAEAAYDSAKKEYEHYSTVVLPMEMFNAGVSKIELASGGIMSYERKYYCNPNKNEKDRLLIAKWLADNGGEHLIKYGAKVDGAQMDLLKSTDVPYIEVMDVNTTSLKAFIKDKLGINGGTPSIQIQDIPPCVHFCEVGVVNIEA